MYHPMERLRVHSGVRPVILLAAEGMVQPVFTPNASIIHSSILQIYLGTQERSDLRSAVQIYHEHKRHGFEMYGPLAKYLQRGLIMHR